MKLSSFTVHLDYRWRTEICKKNKKRINQKNPLPNTKQSKIKAQYNRKKGRRDMRPNLKIFIFTDFDQRNKNTSMVYAHQVLRYEHLILFNDFRNRIHVLQWALVEKTCHLKSSKVVLIDFLLTLKAKSWVEGVWTYCNLEITWAQRTVAERIAIIYSCSQ